MHSESSKCVLVGQLACPLSLSLYIYIYIYIYIYMKMTIIIDYKDFVHEILAFLH